MSYIGDMRKFVGHAPIMSVAAMGILYNKDLIQKHALNVMEAERLHQNKEQCSEVS